MNENFDENEYVNPNESFDEEDNGFDIAAERINIPDTDASQMHKGTNGIKLFCFALCFVILISGFSVGGYFLGRNSVVIPKEDTKFDKIDLSDRPDDGAQTTSQIYQKVADSVVGILVYNDNGNMGYASGVVCTEGGYIITNDHIYASIPSAKFKVILNSGEEYDAYFVAGDTRSDLAVIKIADNVKLRVPEFGDSTKVITGESVCAIGCPNGYGEPSTVTAGIVSVPNVRTSVTSAYSSNFIQTDTPLNPGNSGGALVNSYGQIIGIVSSKISATSYEGVGFAVPTKTVKKVVSSLIENGYVASRSRIGVTYRLISSALAEINDFKSVGLLIDAVGEDCSLKDVLRKNDIITHVNDVLINDDAILLDLLEETAPNSKIKLTVLHTSGISKTYEATLLSDIGTSSYSTHQEKDQ